MRLTCPNCTAQYEVDDSVIPRGGRDVQCSACGHTWYQYPKEVALEMRAAEMDDEDDDEGDAGSAPPVRAAPRIDKTVLDVLRDEAEREMAERRRDRASLESQGDLGLSRPSRSKAAPSRIYGEDDPAQTRPQSRPEPEPDDAIPRDAPRRRKMLPDIEELSSTLEPGGGGRMADTTAESDSSAEGHGMRRGLTVVLLVAAGPVLVYLLAPQIVVWLPASAGVLTQFVEAVNGLRASVAELLRGVLGG